MLDLVGNPEDQFSCIMAHFHHCFREIEQENSVYLFIDGK